MKPIFFVILALLIPLAGYAVMHGMVYVLPVSSNTGVQLLFTVLIIALGLSVPYWMLKAGVHKAHLSDPLEKEVELRNVSKDMNEIAK